MIRIHALGGASSTARTGHMVLPRWPAGTHGLAVDARVGTAVAGRP